MLVEERQHSLVSSLILLLNLRIIQVRTSSHPAVDLRRESLNVVRHLQVGLESLDIIRDLILRSKHSHGDIHLLSIVGVDHSGVALNSRLEGLVVLARGQAGNLSSPAVAEDGPLEATAAGGELVGFGDDARDPGERVGRSGLGLEEVAEILLVLVGCRRVPGNVGWAAFEEVGHEDSVFLFVGGCEDVGALDCLVEEAEDVYRC